jgi:hypothetical protein
MNKIYTAQEIRKAADVELYIDVDAYLAKITEACNVIANGDPRLKEHSIGAALGYPSAMKDHLLGIQNQFSLVLDRLLELGYGYTKGAHDYFVTWHLKQPNYTYGKQHYYPND